MRPEYSTHFATARAKSEILTSQPKPTLMWLPLAAYVMSRLMQEAASQRHLPPPCHPHIKLPSRGAGSPDNHLWSSVNFGFMEAAKKRRNDMAVFGW